MAKQKSSFGLILSSIVAVVAMVGIVMLFGSHATGAGSYNTLECDGVWETVWYLNEEGRYATSNIVCNPRTSTESYPATKQPDDLDFGRDEIPTTDFPKGEGGDPEWRNTEVS